MMSRTEVYRVIDDERIYQVTNFPQNEEPMEELSKDILLLEGYINKAGLAWLRKEDRAMANLAAAREIAKVAALAVRALERWQGSEQLLTGGLR